MIKGVWRVLCDGRCMESVVWWNVCGESVV